jgi:integrase
LRSINSILLDGRESIKTVSERLGPSDPTFTLRTYTHLMPDSTSRTRAVIDAAFDRLSTQQPSSCATDVPQVGS